MVFLWVFIILCNALCKARMFSDTLSKIHFWGWQLIIVLAAVTLLAGFTTGKEYAELEWPIDILITIIWVVFGWNMFGTIIKTKRKTFICSYLVLYRHVCYCCGVAFG
jgi:cytochrome c oxidase cbb3-type subunit I/II